MASIQTFARLLDTFGSGNPNGPSLLGWPAYQASRDQWLVFDDEDQVRAGVIAAKLDYLEAHFMQRTSASR